MDKEDGIAHRDGWNVPKRGGLAVIVGRREKAVGAPREKATRGKAQAAASSG